MSDIFISYKREEQPVARKLADALEKRGWSVWWDPKLRAGEHFDDAIEKALIDAKCVIVMWSKLSVKSRYVKDEATYALKRNKLVPILIEEVNLPFRFESIQTDLLINWDGSDSFPGYQKLIADIAILLRELPIKQNQAVKNQKQLADHYVEARNLFQNQEWQAVVNVFSKIAAIDKDFSDPDGLLSRAERELSASKSEEEDNSEENEKGFIEIARDQTWIAYDNGVVRDTNTGLEWFAGPDSDTTWHQASLWVKSLKVGGGGWRMPTTDELLTLYKEGTGTRNMTPLLKTSGWWLWAGETKRLSAALDFKSGGGGRWVRRADFKNFRAFAVRFWK